MHPRQGAQSPTGIPRGIAPCAAQADMQLRIGEQRRLTGLSATGDQHVEPGGDGGLEEAGRLTRERAERDQLVERVRLQHELADVDRHVAPGDVRRRALQSAVLQLSVRRHPRSDPRGRAPRRRASSTLEPSQADRVHATHPWETNPPSELRIVTVAPLGA
jgi:hypothetical protein